MDEFLIVGTTQLDTSVYMSELSAETLADNGLSGDRSGLYLYETSDDPASKGIRVLATVPNPEAAYRILDLLGVRAL
jgi:hypothetical protein